MTVCFCRKCEWFQALKRTDAGETLWGCIWTKRNHRVMFNCPKYIKAARFDA